MYAYVYTACIDGLNPKTIKVEVAGYNGLPGVTITGLPDTVVKESFHRISTVFKSYGIELPPKKLTVNFLPADVPKKGSGFDLPIATAILKAIGVIPEQALNEYLLYGELSLTGELESVKGVLPVINHAKNSFEKIIIPEANSNEASFFKDKTIIIKELKDLFKIVNNEDLKIETPVIAKTKRESYKDFSDVIGQPVAIRAAQIAVTGGHHILLIGAPGCGKSMIGERLPSIMPELSENEKLEVNSIYSIAGMLENNYCINSRPYRAPHHTISDSALIGGQRPGEITLAHKGILFLDELSEFKHNVLNALREPLEKGYINIARANYNHRLPADFLLLGASNPCDCGSLLKRDGSCKCNNASLQRFRRRLNGPLMDRFDIKVVMSPPKLSYEELYNNKKIKKSSNELKEQVINALKYSKELKEKGIKQKLNDDAKKILDRFINSGASSIRQIKKIINLSKTIASLEAKDVIEEAEILESINYASTLISQ